MKISRALYALVSAATTWSGVGRRHPVLSIMMKSPAAARSSHKTCNDWTAQMPPRTEPAIIMQVVSEGFLPVQKNFIVLMEANSGFTRENIYLMCLDKESQEEMSKVGLRCVPVFDHWKDDLVFVWKLRVKVLSCLLAAGYNVILSDSDALWLKDPEIDFSLPEVRGSNIVAARGSFPEELGHYWGATLCMGFIFFRAGAGMDTVVENMERLATEMRDDQKGVNYALDHLKIQWDHSSDMRYVKSTDFGRGTIGDINEHGLNVTLLPHSKYTRKCDMKPIGAKTVVAHCLSDKHGPAKIEWMKNSHLWKTHELRNNPTMGQRAESEGVVKSSEGSDGSVPPSMNVSSGGH